MLLDQYAEMVKAKKDVYIDTVLGYINYEGEIDIEVLREVHEVLAEYVLLDLTYRKLIDIHMDTGTI